MGRRRSGQRVGEKVELRLAFASESSRDALERRLQETGSRGDGREQQR
jgi:hypothetical protein